MVKRPPAPCIRQATPGRLGIPCTLGGLSLVIVFSTLGMTAAPAQSAQIRIVSLGRPPAVGGSVKPIR